MSRDDWINAIGFAIGMTLVMLGFTLMLKGNF